MTGIHSDMKPANLLMEGVFLCLVIALRSGFRGQTGILSVVFCFGRQPCRSRSLCNSGANRNTTFGAFGEGKLKKFLFLLVESRTGEILLLIFITDVDAGPVAREVNLLL